MNSFKFKSGAVFEVPLAKGYGYGYVKVVNFDVEYPDTMIKPLNLFSKTPWQQGFQKIEELPEIFVPYLLLGGIPVRGKDKWKHLGDVPIKMGEEQIPNFRRLVSLFIKRLEGKDLREAKWEIVRNLEPTDYCDATFDEIKNLGEYMHCSYKYIGESLAMSWMFKHGINIEEYFSAEELSDRSIIAMVMLTKINVGLIG